MKRPLPDAVKGSGRARLVRLKLVESVLSDRIVREAGDPALAALAEIDPNRHRVVARTAAENDAHDA